MTEHWDFSFRPDVGDAVDPLDLVLAAIGEGDYMSYTKLYTIETSAKARMIHFYGNICLILDPEEDSVYTVDLATGDTTRVGNRSVYTTLETPCSSILGKYLVFINSWNSGFHIYKDGLFLESHYLDSGNYWLPIVISRRGEYIGVYKWDGADYVEIWKGS